MISSPKIITIRLKQGIKDEKGNFLVLVSFIAISLVLFFSIFAELARSYSINQENAEFSTYALYSAESAMENISYEYNKNIKTGEANTIFNKEERICYNTSFDVLEYGQGIVDYGVNCSENGNNIIFIGNDISKINKYATRMVKSESFYIDRYQIKEYRMTKYEFLEKYTDSDNLLKYAYPKSLKITWIADSNVDDPNIEIIFASWKIINEKTSSDIKVHRFVPNNKLIGTNGQGLKVYQYELFDVSKENLNVFFDFDNYEYIVFFKSMDKPLHVFIEGINYNGTEGDISTWEPESIKIPSRFLYLEVRAEIENEQDPLKSFTRKIKSKKQFYTDFDSNFPYARYKIFPEKFKNLYN